MSEPLVSVMVPAYNHEKYVGETIESVINQSYTNIEFIVIDDGSIDQTATVIKSYENKCKGRFAKNSFIFNKNFGLVNSLNQGISIARGLYFISVASDDILLPNAIKSLLDFLEENKSYGLAVGDNIIINESGKRCFWDRKQNIVDDRDAAFSTTFADHIQKKDKGFNMLGSDFGKYSKLLSYNHVPCGFLLRRSILDTIGGYSIKHPLEDLGIMLQFSKVSKMKYIDTQLYGYRWHGLNSITNKEKYKRAYFETIKNEIDYAKPLGLLTKVPSYRTYSFLGVPLIVWEDTDLFTKFSVFGINIYRKKTSKLSVDYKVLGLQIYSIRK